MNQLRIKEPHFNTEQQYKPEWANTHITRVTQQQKEPNNQSELPEKEEGEEREAEEEEGMKEQWSREEREAATLRETEVLLPVRNVREAEVVGLVESEGDNEIAESVAIFFGSLLSSFSVYPQTKMRFCFCFFALSSRDFSEKKK